MKRNALYRASYATPGTFVTRLDLPRLRYGKLFSPLPRRHQSTSTTSAETPSSLVSRMKTLFYSTSFVLALGIGYFYITDTRASAHRWVVVPALRLIYSDAEDAHHAGNRALKALWNLGLYPRERGDPDKAGDLTVDVFGHTLVNPIGTSGGIDKDADIPNPLFAIGPAIIEVGGITPLPQEGNQKPRVFRIPSQNALINRYGLNSEGADYVAMQLRRRVREFANSLGYGLDQDAEDRVLDGEAGVPPGSLVSGRLLAVQVAKNKWTPEGDVEAVKSDYIYCVERLAPYADILVVNVSSPNTPGLRSLQQSGPLTQILSGVVQAAKNTNRATKPSVMVKVSPDEDSDDQIQGICKAIWASGVDGVIVGNTTKRRPEPAPTEYQLSPTEQQIMLEQGGYSGPQTFERTLDLVKRYRRALETRPLNDADPKQSQASVEPESTTSAIKQKVGEAFEAGSRKVEAAVSTAKPTAGFEQSKVIFATGGISNGKQALEILNAGASVAMVYTALVYGGIGTVSRIKAEMRQEMKLSGSGTFATLQRFQNSQ
ncbi:MAG: hypothetical protein Q9227_002874 [Pyrenula ochraceoflavens]